MRAHMKHLPSIITLTLLALLVAAPSFALPITPVSYDMKNGGTGVYHYWDDSYNGSGSTSTNYAQLSGGHGDLTDGIIATKNYDSYYPVSPGPYVGWYNMNPIITFHFGSVIDLSSLTLFLDNFHSNLVYLPSSVTLSMGGTTLTYSIYDGNTATPIAATFSNLNLFGDTLTMTLNSQKSNEWTFLSEVEFDGTNVVPEPATILLVGPVLLGLAGYTWRRKFA